MSLGKSNQIKYLYDVVLEIKYESYYKVIDPE